MATSLFDPSGSVLAGYDMDFSFGNYVDALTDYWEPLLRSLWYAGLATLLCLILGYVLAYAIAFKAGRWKNLMLVLVIAPFFTSFLVRTLSWKLILADDGVIVNTLQFLQILGDDGRLLATPFAVIAGLTYNFLPFMVLPLFASIDKIDQRLIEASSDLYAITVRRLLEGHLAALVAGRHLRHAAHVHPGGRRLHQRPAARQPEPADGRQRHPEPLHRRQQLPGRRCPVDDHDAADRGDGLVLRPPRGYGGAALMMWLAVSNLVLLLGLIVLAYTFVPIAVVVLMSFNAPKSRLVYKFDGFTLHNWLNPCEDPSMCSALGRSVEIGLLATVVATILGTLMAFALVRHDFAGRSSMNLLIFLPMATPEIVMGSSLLALFIAVGVGGSLGFWTILIAHIMFCISFVVVTVRARLAGMNDTLEQAAADLYATPRADVLEGHLPARLPRHPGRRPAELLAVLRRLHRDQPELRDHDDVPHVRLGCRPARRPDAGQRRRHPDVRDLDRDRARRRGPQPGAYQGAGGWPVPTRFVCGAERRKPQRTADESVNRESSAVLRVLRAGRPLTNRLPMTSQRGHGRSS